MDYEVELALVLSRDTRDVQPQDALDHVLGWTVANDLTARKWQGKCSQWGFCKGERSAERDGRQSSSVAALGGVSSVTGQLCDVSARLWSLAWSGRVTRAGLQWATRVGTGRS